MSWLFASGGQSISPSSEYSRLISFRTLTAWISLQSKELSLVFSSSTVRKHQFFGAQLYGPTLTSRHDYWRNHSFGYTALCLQRDVSAFNMLSRFVITLLPRTKHLVISWLQSSSTVILEPKKRKFVTTPTFPLLFARK